MLMISKMQENNFRQRAWPYIPINKFRGFAATFGNKYITYDRRSSVRPYRVRVYQHGERKLKYVGRFSTIEEAIEARDNYIQKMALQNKNEDMQDSLDCESLKATEIPW